MANKRFKVALQWTFHMIPNLLQTPLLINPVTQAKKICIILDIH